MRRFHKFGAVTIAVIIFILSIFAVHIFAAMIVDGYSFDLDDNKCAVINGWNNSSDTLSIPANIGDFRVTAIENSAFKNDDYIKTLDFSDASYLDRIGMYAFAESSLEGLVVIPTRVSNIGISAFERCNSITEVSYSSLGGIVSAQCFQYCENLQTVFLTDYITAIERYAFYNCQHLSTVTIPRSVTSISPTAFSGCEELVIHCYTDSYAHQYAEDNGIDYVLIDAPTPTDPTVPTEPTTVTEATVPTETEATEPTVATEPPTTAPEGYILGDADNSGNVDIVDATFAQRYVTHSDIPEEMLSGMDVRADVDSNGDVEATDVTFIMRHLIRVPTPYPIGELITI